MTFSPSWVQRFGHNILQSLGRCTIGQHEDQGAMVNGLIGAQTAVIIAIVQADSAAYTQGCRLKLTVIVHYVNGVDGTIGLREARNSGS